MHILRKATAALVLVTAAGLAPVSLASASEAAPVAQAGVVSQPSGDVTAAGGSIDLISGSLHIAQQIFDIALEQAQLNANRAGLLRSLQNAARYKTGHHNNIIVMVAPDGSTKGRFSTHFNKKVSDAVYHYDGYPPFRVVAFKTGKVTNNGDGGYINWAFHGWWNRKGMTVTFHRP